MSTIPKSKDSTDVSALLREAGAAKRAEGERLRAELKALQQEREEHRQHAQDYKAALQHVKLHADDRCDCGRSYADIADTGLAQAKGETA